MDQREPLAGCKVLVYGPWTDPMYLTLEEARSSLTALGAICVHIRDLQPEQPCQLTHIVTTQELRQKSLCKFLWFRALMGNTKVHVDIVSPEWVIECARQWTRVPEGDYLIHLLGWHPTMAPLSVRSNISHDAPDNCQAPPDNFHHTAPIDSSGPGTLSLPLAGCRVARLGPTSIQPGQIENMVVALGGHFLPAVFPINATHVVVDPSPGPREEHHSETYSGMIRANVDNGAIFVKSDWLVRCYSEMRKVPKNEFSVLRELLLKLPGVYLPPDAPPPPPAPDYLPTQLTANNFTQPAPGNFPQPAPVYLPQAGVGDIFGTGILRGCWLVCDDPPGPSTSIEKLSELVAELGGCPLGQLHANAFGRGPPSHVIVTPSSAVKKRWWDILVSEMEEIERRGRRLHIVRPSWLLRCKAENRRVPEAEHDAFKELASLPLPAPEYQTRRNN